MQESIAELICRDREGNVIGTIGIFADGGTMFIGSTDAIVGTLRLLGIDFEREKSGVLKVKLKN